MAVAALKSKTNPRGKSAFMLALEEARDAAPLVTRCALCDWTHSGTVVEGREAARAHRVAVHPPPKKQRRRAKPKPKPRRPKTHCLRGHSLLDDANVHVGPTGSRTCRTCARQRQRQRRRAA